MKHRSLTVIATGAAGLAAVAATGFIIAFGLTEPAYVASFVAWIGALWGVAALIKSAAGR